MKRKFGRILALAMAICMVFAAVPAFAHTQSQVNDAIKDTTSIATKAVQGALGDGQMGEDWLIFDLARSGEQVDESIFEKYYADVVAYTKAKKGVLSARKYTEYSRTVLVLTAIGKDPRDVGGYNLLTPLGDYEKTIWQGINGPTWALIALDSGNYEIPKNSEAAVQATREKYIDCILSRQLNNGGWTLNGGETAEEKDQLADVDLTGMVLQALAKYQDQPKVKAATEKALVCLSKLQGETGGYAESVGYTECSESFVQVMVALGELGIDLNDSRFVKNGKSTVDNLLENFYFKGKGFAHPLGSKDANGMATEQAYYGLISAKRAMEGKNSLYRLSDHITISGGETAAPAPETTAPKADISFSDISGNANEKAIIELASRGIINGMGDGTFAPNATMTRAQFAAIVTRSLGFEAEATSKFTDVPASKWYAGYIGAANGKGIVNGRSATTFDPEGLITRQEAAVMVTNAAKICMMKTDLDSTKMRDTLAQFSDYITIADWAKNAMAFCYSEGIYDESDLNTNPTTYIHRGEIAQMLYNMLSKAFII